MFCWFPSVSKCASIAEKTAQGNNFWWRKERISTYNLTVNARRVSMKSEENCSLGFSQSYQASIWTSSLILTCEAAWWPGLIISPGPSESIPGRGKPLWWVHVRKAVAFSGTCLSLPAIPPFSLAQALLKGPAGPLVGIPLTFADLYFPPFFLDIENSLSFSLKTDECPLPISDLYLSGPSG